MSISLLTAYLVTFADIRRKGEGIWPNSDNSGQGKWVDFYCIFADVLYGWPHREHE